MSITSKILALFPWPAPRRPAYLPDPILTPGAVRDATPEEIRRSGSATAARHVTEATKRVVCAAYGIRYDGQVYEVDHLIPLALGGANLAENLFPMPWEGDYNAHQKDRLEVRMYARFLRGEVALEAAQADFRGDWTTAYRREFPAGSP